MIGLETGDGLQTMRVTNAFDDEHFPIPIEKSRFEFQIQAGALSVAFEAVPGIGKVDLNSLLHKQMIFLATTLIGQCKSQIQVLVNFSP